MSAPLHIAIDAMSGDRGPSVSVPAAVAAAVHRFLSVEERPADASMLWAVNPSRSVPGEPDVPAALRHKLCVDRLLLIVGVAGWVARATVRRHTSSAYHA